MEDGFVASEDDPVKSHALQSSLWELSVFERHYYPAVATLAKSIGRAEEDKAPLYNIEEFANHTNSIPTNFLYARWWRWEWCQLDPVIRTHQWHQHNSHQWSGWRRSCFQVELVTGSFSTNEELLGPLKEVKSKDS